MKFETNRAKMDLLQDVLRRPFSQNMATKVEQIMCELEMRIDDMENQSSRLYHLKRPAEYNEYLQVRKVFDNYFIVATNYLAQPTGASSTIQIQAPDKSTGAIPKVTKTKKEEDDVENEERAPTPPPRDDSVHRGKRPRTDKETPARQKSPPPDSRKRERRESTSSTLSIRGLGHTDWGKEPSRTPRSDHRGNPTNQGPTNRNWPGSHA